MTILFCAHRKWAKNLYRRLAKRYKSIILLSSPNDLTIEYLNKTKPKYIFFPDWSWIISSEIVNKFNCICIHESNLPKFKGGSPIQNQIIRGIKKTKSTAFIMTEELDGGDILLEQDLLLTGTLDEIFERMVENDYQMIVKIIQGKFKRKKQKGKPTSFKRRTPKESELKNLNYSKKYLYDFIRMLADPYPNAYMKIGKRKIIFKSATYEANKLRFTGEIL